MSHEVSLDPRVEDARDMVLEYIKDHEAENHDGGRCSNNRIGLMGYFGHCLALTEDERHMIADAIQVYDERCPECQPHEVSDDHEEKNPS